LIQFRREAELGTRLIGPSLLPVHEFGEADGRAFMAMPLINGGTLGDAIAARLRRPPGRPAIAGPWWASLPDEAFALAMVRVLARIARGLEVVHAGRVVHRDIKPANILLDRSREDRPFLCDFGLGRHFDDPLPPDRRISGTPLYMAPEKILGRDCDEVRCDLYSLGVTLFEAVTLVHPFPLPRNVPRACLATYIATTVPPRPRSIRPEIPQSLESIIIRAMARHPERRYATAGELARDLEWVAASHAPAACG
jgi:serine/threonine-protein kinase